MILAGALAGLAACSGAGGGGRGAGTPSRGPDSSAPPAGATGQRVAPAAAASAAADPCALITKDEAQGVLGEPVGDPQRSTLGSVSICDYRTLQVHGGVLPYSVHLALVPEGPSVWDAGKKLHARELRPVTDLGADAYFLLDDLDVHVGGQSLTINVLKSVDTPTHQHDVEAAELTVARAAIPRLQSSG